MALDPAQPLAEALGEKDGAFGIVVDPILLARLDMKLGDRLMIGNARVEPRAKLDSEPDKLAGGVGFGPRVMMTRAALAATGLMTPGSVVRHVTRVTLNGNVSDDDVKSFAKAAEATFPQAGWEARTRDAVSPQFSRNLERFTQLLTLVALTALVAGGAGVANAVQGFVERKRMQFAVLKALGATGLARLRHRAGAGDDRGGFRNCSRARRRRPHTMGGGGGAALGRGIARLGGARRARHDLRRALWPAGHIDFRARRRSAARIDIPVAALLRDDPRRRSAHALSPGARRLPRSRSRAGDAVLGRHETRRRLTSSPTGAAFALLRGAAWLDHARRRALPRPQDARLRLAIANICRPKSLDARR